MIMTLHTHPTQTQLQSKAASDQHIILPKQQNKYQGQKQQQQKKHKQQQKQHQRQQQD